MDEEKLSKKEIFQPPRGTRDFFPEDMILRERVFDTVKKVFQRWGFDPFKTPSFENYDLFAMKESIGTGESDKLYVFKDKSGRKLSLRFDQSVPFARQVAANPQIPKPIRRYEISRVWRYEEVKQGRWREFWQCDVDIVGTKSMLADAEIIGCTLDVLKELGFDDSYMRINNRNLLSAILQYSGVEENKIIDAYRSIDKYDKIGIEGVKKELKERGFQNDQIIKIIKIMEIKGNPEEILGKIGELVGKIDLGNRGIKELNELVMYLEQMGINNIKIDLSLVRGLDYYTSTIFEAMGSDVKIGSLGGGGRYDKIIGTFAGIDGEIPVVGIGIGIERVLELIKKKGDEEKTYCKVFVVNVSDDTKKDCIKVTNNLREAGINTQTDLMDRSLSRQLEYINSMKIPYAIIIGRKELEMGVVKIRDMSKGTEKEIKSEDVISILKSL